MAVTTDAEDVRHMRTALGLARRGLGATWPNPTVGCVLVREGRVVARGWTGRGGRPHGETEALRRAAAAAHGATAYVSLEPCAHQGKAPPCADALVAGGIARAVIAVEDPDPRVRGRGVERLRDGGVETQLGVLADEAGAINAGFFSRIERGRPLVTCKAATTLDGRIATHGGESRWITGEAARARAHGLRAENDAVMVGIGTVLADDPTLTCRLPGMEARSPLRVVFDGHLRLPLLSRLVVGARKVPTWVVTLKGGDAARAQALRDLGVEIIAVAADDDGRVSLAAGLAALGGRGLTRVLVEGGGTFAAGLMRAGLIDRLAWFRAPRIMGGDGVPALAAFGVDGLDDMPRFRRLDAETLGADLLETYALRS